MHVITYVCIVSFSDEEDEMIWQFTARGGFRAQAARAVARGVAQNLQ